MFILFCVCVRTLQPFPNVAIDTHLGYKSRGKVLAPLSHFCITSMSLAFTWMLFTSDAERTFI